MRKKCNLVIVLAVAALTATAAGGPYVCADADGSGSVNVGDAVFYWVTSLG